MDAKIFSRRLQEIAPTMSDLQQTGLSEGGSIEIIREWIVSENGKGIQVDDPILDLVYNYDTVDIGVGSITIDDRIQIIENYTLFGNFEGDFLAIDNCDKKIKVICYETGNIIFECADSSACFIEALVPVAYLRAMKYKNTIINDEIKTKIAHDAVQKAGNVNYLPFYYRLIGLVER